MAVIMRDALKPNLMQTLENTPVLVHAGPFGNIAHGNSSVVADLIGIHGGDFLVTEAGFGADMGAERFFNIKCRASGLTPDAAVVVATVRALKAHSGKHKIVAGKPLPEALLAENPDEVHIGGGQPAQADREHPAPRRLAGRRDQRVPRRPPVASSAAIARDRGGDGRAGRGLHALRRRRPRARPSWPRRSPRRPRSRQRLPVPLPGLDATLKEKIETIATKVYGAAGVDYDLAASRQLATYEANGFGNLPVCIAKTHLSIVVRRVAQGGADGLAPAGPRGAGLGRRRVHLPDLRRHAHHAGPRRHPGGPSIDIDEDGKIVSLS